MPNIELSGEITGGHYVDNAKINAAAQEIIQACLDADDPVASLHRELNRLRTGGWTELELYRLQVALLNTAKQIAINRAAALETVLH